MVRPIGPTQPCFDQPCKSYVGCDASDHDRHGIYHQRCAERVETALETVGLVFSPIESAMQSVISRVLKNLLLFLRYTTTGTRRISPAGQLYDATSDVFKKLIVPIQFHDITRQQVEHELDTLRRLSYESEGEPGNVRDPTAIPRWPWLQSLQLADGGNKFAASFLA